MPPSGQKGRPTDENPKKLFFDSRKKGFLDVYVGKPTDLVQDWVRGFYCGFSPRLFGAFPPLPYQ